MRKSHKILTAVAVAGIVFAGGSAFTGTGLATDAGATQFIGGTVSQTVTGATLATVEYGFTNEPVNTTVSGATLTFTDTEDGQPVAVTTQGGSVVTVDCGLITDSVATCVFDPALTELSGLEITVGTVVVPEV